MALKPLLIGPAEKRMIEDLRIFAAANVIDAQAAITTAAADEMAFRDAMMLHAMELPVGYRVHFTHELQPDPRLGVVQHISISIDTPGRMPSVEAVEVILAAFDMRPLRHAVRTWIEDVDAQTKAINVIQKLGT